MTLPRAPWDEPREGWPLRPRLAVGLGTGHGGLGLLDFPGVTHTRLRLLDWPQATTSRQLKRFDNHPPPQNSQFVMQAGCCVISRNGQFFHHQHVAGIQALVHLHDGDAGVGITSLNGTMNWCCATPSWQHGGMDVQTSEFRQLQQPGRQNQPVGCDHNHIRLRGFDGGFSLFGLIREFAIEP